MTNYKKSLLLPRPSNSAPPFLISNPSMVGSSSSPVVGRSVALKVHSQAEKRRRERINEHLSTLRRMVPDATKMDKASLLGRVLDHVKDLKRKALDITQSSSSIPTEANEVMVQVKSIDESNSDNNKSFYIEASVCCDDHPDLFVNLVRAFHGLRLRAIRAEITALGGRVQTVFILCDEKDVNGSTVCISSLKENVKDALVRVANAFDGVPVDASKSKRQRLLQHSYNSAVTI